MDDRYVRGDHSDAIDRAVRRSRPSQLVVHSESTLLLELILRLHDVAYWVTL